MGGAFLGGCVSIFSMQDASLSRTEKFSLSASVRGAISFPIAARHLRRLFCLCGRAGRPGAFAAANVDTRPDGEDSSYEASVTCLKSAEKGRGPDKKAR